MHEATSALGGGSHGPIPYTRRTITWASPTPAAKLDELDITATNVAAVTIDAARAGVDCQAKLKLKSDGPLKITLTGCNPIPSPPVVFSCSRPSGRLTQRSLGPVTLGMTRARARAQFLRRSTHGRRYMDYFCLSRIGIRVGYPSPTLLGSVGRSLRSRVSGRVVLALAANPYYALRGVHPGARLAAVADRLHAGHGYRVGLNTWYLAPNGASHAVLKVRRGVIVEIGVADKQLTSSRRAALLFFESFA